MKKKQKDSGVVTLEACIVMPAFILLMLLVNGLFVFFMGQQMMAHAAIQSAKSLSFDAYAADRTDPETGKKLPGMILDLFEAVSTLTSGAENPVYPSKFASNKKWYAEGSGDLEDTVKERFLAYLVGNDRDADSVLKLIGVEGGEGGLDFTETAVSDGFLIMKIKYTQNFPYSAGELTSFERLITVKVKLFNYKKG